MSSKRILNIGQFLLPIEFVGRSYNTAGRYRKDCNNKQINTVSSHASTIIE